MNCIRLFAYIGYLAKFLDILPPVAAAQRIFRTLGIKIIGYLGPGDLQNRRSIDQISRELLRATVLETGEIHDSNHISLARAYYIVRNTSRDAYKFNLSLMGVYTNILLYILDFVMLLTPFKV